MDRRDWFLLGLDRLSSSCVFTSYLPLICPYSKVAPSCLRYQSYWILAYSKDLIYLNYPFKTLVSKHSHILR